jgi:HAD superfamily hydrolase (TIGR01509 family)
MNERKRPSAVIFDMDGTMVHNHGYHLDAWLVFCKQHGLQITTGDLRSMFGRKNEDIFRVLFGRDISPTECRAFEDQKEALYRQLYRPYLSEISGLTSLLEKLAASGIPAGVATSAPVANVDFVLDSLGLRHFFKCIVHAGMIVCGKPNPEIFLKAAEGLGVKANDCLVFEDAPAGLEAAHRAGTRAIAMLTSHPKELLPNAETFIVDFTDPVIESILFG